MDYVEAALQAFWDRKFSEHTLESRARMQAALRAAALQCPSDLRSSFLRPFIRKPING